MKQYIHFFLIFTFLCACQNKAINFDDERLLPEKICNVPSIEPIKKFNANNLYQYINGAADLFIEYGFENLLVKDYIKEEYNLSIELYLMSSNESAYGIFSLQKYPYPSEILENIYISYSEYQTLFCIDKIYGVIRSANPMPKDEYENKIINCIRSNKYLSNKQITLPAFCNLMRIDGLIDDSLVLINGKIGLRNFLDLKGVEPFGFTLGNKICIGDYRLDGTEFKVFSIMCQNETNALYTSNKLSQSILDSEKADLVIEQVENFVLIFNPSLGPSVRSNWLGRFNARLLEE